MNPILLNGQPVMIPTEQSERFRDVFTYLKNNMDSNTALISAVKIDGVEVPNTEDEILAQTPLSHFKRIEFFTSHPKEVADETLQDLLAFSSSLEDQATFAAEQIADRDFPHHFNRLIDGVTTFTEAVSGVKRILKLGLFNSIQALEAELLRVLRDILAAHENRQMDTISQLLKADLPENLKKWRENGLPDLIRSRDS
jgi:hypothetical protein